MEISQEYYEINVALVFFSNFGGKKIRFVIIGIECLGSLLQMETYQIIKRLIDIQ